MLDIPRGGIDSAVLGLGHSTNHDLTPDDRSSHRVCGDPRSAASLKWSSPGLWWDRGTRADRRDQCQYIDPLTGSRFPRSEGSQ
jgi:hypothetical protein